jgi:HD superfamily phosphohydrolase YqeK
MNALTINDIFIEICKNIFDLKQLIKIELISKYHMCLVRKTNWYHFSVYLNEKQIEHVLSIYNFRNLNLHTAITDESILKLINCHTLNLSSTKVTDESVSKLINCHTLNLSYTAVTDKSVSKLINCHTLYLSQTAVTDESVSKLINCHTLSLCCTKVTDESVSKLINCHTLWLYGTKVTNECKKRLINNGCKIYS